MIPSVSSIRAALRLCVLFAALLAGLLGPSDAAFGQAFEVVKMTVNPIGGELHVSWNRNPSGNVPTSYSVHYTASASVDNNANLGSNAATGWVDAGHTGTTTSHVIIGLNYDTTYKVRVAAWFGGGRSPWIVATVTTPEVRAVPGTPTIRLSVFGFHRVYEGYQAAVAAVLSSRIPDEVRVPVTITRGTAESGDIGSLSSITIPAGKISAKGTISTTRDADKDDETFTVSLGSLPGGFFKSDSQNSVTITILDLDKPRTVPVRPQSAHPAALQSIALTLDAERSDGTTLLREIVRPSGFHPDTLNYTVRVDPMAQRALVTAVAQNHYPEDPSVSANGAPGEKDFTGRWVELNQDRKMIRIVVTAPDGSTRTYTVTVLKGNAPAPATANAEVQAQLEADAETITIAIGDTQGSTAPKTQRPPTTPPQQGDPQGQQPQPQERRLPPQQEQSPQQTDRTPAAEENDQETQCGTERETLEGIYEATGGDMWDDSTYWTTENPLGDWYGVSTDDETGKVVSLLLADNNLSGDMPGEELSCLAELKELALWGNDLTGDVPEGLVPAVERAVLRDIADSLDNESWLESLEGVTTNDGRITGLRFSDEAIEGELPASLLELEELETLDIGCSGVTLGDDYDLPESVTVKEDCDEPEASNAPDEANTPDEEERTNADSGGGGCALGNSEGVFNASSLLLASLLMLMVCLQQKRQFRGFFKKLC